MVEKTPLHVLNLPFVPLKLAFSLIFILFFLENNNRQVFIEFLMFNMY